MSDQACRSEVAICEPDDLSAISESVRAFFAVWFPDSSNPNSVQAFWFAAKYPRERKFFRKLCSRFGPVLESIRCLRSSEPHAFDDIDHGTLFRLCIFIDQQSRNMRAIEKDVSCCESLERDIKDWTQFVLTLARRVLEAAPTVHCLFQSLDATAAEICFFTLTLRHTQTLAEVRCAAALLRELDELHSGLEVVGAFQRENDAVQKRLETLAYVEETVRAGVPELWASSAMGADPPPSDGMCLAPECKIEGEFLSWGDHGDTWAKIAESPLSHELLSSLHEYGLLNGNSHIILSYSGGVDSTAHLLLLLAVLYKSPLLTTTYPSAARPRLSCMMLAYPNRDDHEVACERQWASWVCGRLGVDLYGFVVRLARPHGDSKGHQEGLSREEYERHTKEIRFRMYQYLLGDSSEGGACVILGHHLDDVDENRLDHLQRGHLLGDVEGMRPWREIFGVPLLRPLLRHRKAEFQSLLHLFSTPYLRDSTPTWSIRGTTRRVLDSLSPAIREDMIAKLNVFGSLAAEVGIELSEAIEAWVVNYVKPLALPRGASCTVLDLDALFNLSVGSRIVDIANLAESIRATWNPAASKDILDHVSSPAVEIPCNQAADVNFFLFERGFFAAAHGLLSKRPGHFHSSEVVSVSRKAVRHLFETSQDCKKGDFGGGLTQELGYVHVVGPPKHALALYDSSAHLGTNFKDMRCTIINAINKM